MISRGPKRPLSRPEVSAIVKRLVKPETLELRRDIILFYRLLDLYPNRAFWLVYEPGFPLNSIAFFLTEEGADQLKTDHSVFMLDLGPQPCYTMGPDKVGEDIKFSKTIRSMSDLFSI